MNRSRCFLVAALLALLIAGCSRGDATPPDRLEPNDSPTEATTVALDYFSGELTITANDVDWFIFTLAEPTTVIAEVEAWALGSGLDPVMALVDADGVFIFISDDDYGLDPRIEAGLAAGTYYIAVIGYGDTHGIYHLSITVGPAIDP